MSNGVRFVSAMEAVRNSRKPTGCEKMPQLCDRSWTSKNTDCCATMAEGSSVPKTRNEPRIDMPSVTSYEIICELARRPPIIAHLLCDAHPARVAPYTDSDMMAK